MYKIFFLIMGSILSATSLFAAGSMTTSGFTIELGPMDPFQSSEAVPSGKGALLTILENVSDMLLVMIPIIAIFAGIVAGYYYIFSAGDSEKAGQAKNIVKWNLIAIVIAFMSYTIIRLIAELFS